MKKKKIIHQFKNKLLPQSNRIKIINLENYKEIYLSVPVVILKKPIYNYRKIATQNKFTKTTAYKLINFLFYRAS